MFFKGYVTIYIKGRRPELFLNMLMKENIFIWDVQHVNGNMCKGKVYIKDVRKLKQIRRNTHFKISFEGKFGIPFFFARMRTHRPVALGITLACLLILFVSNMVWNVKVVGVNEEIRHEIELELNKYGLKEGTLKYRVDPLEHIERSLIRDIKDLMWVGIEKRGTTYIVQGVEKTVVDQTEEKSPQHLVAAKDGEIIQMMVESGQPVVKVHQIVKKGDILVSGIIGEQKNENEDKEKDDKEEEQKKEADQKIRAEGEIIAETWYQSEVTVPMTAHHETLTGNKDRHYKLRLGKVTVPIWGIFKEDYTETYSITEETTLHFFRWKLPINVVSETMFEKRTIEEQRSEKEAVEKGIEQAKRELSNQLDTDARIVYEKVLHQSRENDKVKLHVFMRVHENIAKPQPIN
nr:sporulation protein YqfD [Salirhabdus salicampi]